MKDMGPYFEGKLDVLFGKDGKEVKGKEKPVARMLTNLVLMRKLRSKREEAEQKAALKAAKAAAKAAAAVPKASSKPKARAKAKAKAKAKANAKSKAKGKPQKGSGKGKPKAKASRKSGSSPMPICQTQRATPTRTLTTSWASCWAATTATSARLPAAWRLRPTLRRQTVANPRLKALPVLALPRHLRQTPGLYWEPRTLLALQLLLQTVRLAGIQAPYQSAACPGGCNLCSCVAVCVILSENGHCRRVRVKCWGAPQLDEELWCAGCGRVWHLKCGLSAAQLKRLADFSTDTWRCRTCRRVVVEDDTLDG